MSKKIIAILLIIGLIILPIAGFGVYAYSAINSPVSQTEKNVDVDISQGQSTDQIAQALQDKGLIKSAFVFKLYSWYTKKTIIPGVYLFKTNMTAKEILDILTKGKVNEAKVTIPEGYRATQIAQILQDAGLISDQTAFLSQTQNLEGKLFPDTYRFSFKTSVSDIINKFTTNYTTQTADINVTNDNLILASIVEREAKNDNDRGMIAGVYQNRLDAGMKLDSDPTIQYALGSWNPLVASDLTVDSPYNTYLYKGLPPTPICNPGIKSIKAAISPVKHDYYYFFNLKDGTTIYSSTLDEHNAKLVQYQSQM